MFALCARIQHLVRDHKYALLGAMASVLWLEKVNYTEGVDLRTEADVFCLLENGWNRGYDLAFLTIVTAIFQ